jgi:hypothetical protein
MEKSLQRWQSDHPIHESSANAWCWHGFSRGVHGSPTPAVRLLISSEAVGFDDRLGWQRPRLVCRGTAAAKWLAIRQRIVQTEASYAACNLMKFPVRSKPRLRDSSSTGVPSAPTAVQSQFAVPRTVAPSRPSCTGKFAHNQNGLEQIDVS